MTPPIDQRQDDPERDIALAGEYVLGLLPIGERRAADARMVTDPAFAARVRDWQADLSNLDTRYAPVAVPAGLGLRIEARLFAGDMSVSRTSLWSSLAFWRGLALASLVAAAGLGALASGLLSPPADDAAPALVARLANPDSNIGLLASFDARSGALSFVPAAFAAEGEHALELWLVPADGAPISMGLVPGDGGLLRLDENLRGRIGEGAVLAVSLEPAGGSPTAGPTGPVLVSGSFARP